MDLALQGKVALVTGGATGIGAGISEYLAMEKVHVAVNYIVDEPQVIEFSERISKENGVSCIPVYADVSKPEDNDAMVKKILDTFGRIDILVNNAGIWPTEDMKDMPDEHWMRVININLNGPYLLSKRVVNSMIERNVKGVIINMSSKSGFQCNTGGHGHYTTAKAGLNMMTRSLAREISSYGIRVVGIAPGMVRTPINEDKWKHDGLMDDYIKRIPVGRFAEPIEIGYLAAFLASDKACNITGTTLDSTGGMLI
ncbi:MAG: SDR family oxidoreductase [Sphaerochaetaceae bacterium]|jgi:NAD(P)-dependent dehydrogenase (short-subunit alcohol dehydrogenase family)|nr:SDR family oxidoreductase [Sphaerochaetaceae bacterium]NLO60685.1 SDR family oxidoreductase [Spirochaetales bacterium]MDD2405384.1 SDR family oxidoreductase [Sphaerochaetaceae bacterium]MDD3669753.1 SDR family oxidoreductase [Sphaerochaetaceae bacterium]MDD4260416.1 SDR family oxidoreductase [Sphaerochaetaceae bacterium]